MIGAIAPIERTKVITNRKIVWKHFTEKKLNQIDLVYTYKLMYL